MKPSLQIACALLFCLFLSACAGKKTSVFAPVIPPPTFRVDPALLDQSAPVVPADETREAEAIHQDGDRQEKAQNP
ncbi:MAG: hypothetical protein FWG81_06410 [Betaproteobacteria bacterium]|nr:hypothetical protein [Betaproteobacteria bacterium]